MSTINIYTHTQIGDHLICYGFIKEYAKQYDQVFTYTNNWTGKMHIDNVKRLYSSLPNVKVIVGTPFTFVNCLVVGQHNWEPALKKDPSIVFDKFFYSEAKMPFNLKWDNFFFERDLTKEKKIFDELGLTENEYIFLHEDPKREYLIKRKYIDNSVRLIEPSKLPDVSILDMLYLVEHAKEVHVINSSFLTFIDLMNIQHENLCYHKYVRSDTQPTLKLKWKIYEV